MRLITGLTLLSVLFCISYADESAIKLLDPCSINDQECIVKFMVDVMKKSRENLPDRHIPVVDPVVVPEFDFDRIEKMGFKLDFKNANIRGFSKLKLAELKVNKEKKTVQFKMNVPVDYNSEMSFRVVKPVEKTFVGTLTGNGTVEFTSSYDYEIKTNDKGIKYLDVGKEEFTCKGIEGTSSMDKKMTDDLLAEPAYKTMMDEYMAHRDNYGKWDACVMAKQIFPRVIQNFRMAARHIPVTSMFTDLI